MIDGGAVSAGKNDLAQGGWAARLHRDSLKVNLESLEEVEVLNFARVGRTLTDILVERRLASEPSYEDRLKGLRMGSELGSRIVSIVGVGHNEAAERDPRKFQRHIGRLCTIANNQSVPLILVGPNRVDPERTTLLGTAERYDNRTIAAYSETMASVAAVHQVSCIDTFPLINPFAFETALISEDGYNPTTEGHGILHEAIKKELDLLNVRL